MFNDHYGLTQAVLERRKTMTRQMELNDILLEYLNNGYLHLAPLYTRFKVGEIVAVAQSYNDVYEELKRTHGSSSAITREFFHKYIQGGRMPVSNKMFVKSEEMPHRIRITDIKAEHLQDISDKDCLKEGITKLQQEAPCDGFFIRDELHYNNLCYNTPREAFAALIDKVSGKGIWGNNPWIIAYTFELVK